MKTRSPLQPWRVRSLRFRILAATAAAATGALVLALLAYALTLQAVLDNTATASATDQANQIASIVTAGDPAAALRDIPAQGSILQLVDQSGSVISYNDTGASRRPLAQLSPGAGQVLSTRVNGVPGDEHDPYIVVARGIPAQGGSGPAVLLVATALQNETRLIAAATLALGVFALLLLVGLLWLINQVLRSALGRVERIRSSVAEIRATHSQASVPVPAGDDEITHLAETMNDMLGRLHRADAAQRAFVSDASHELRSPLTAIRMISETSPAGIDAAGTVVVGIETTRLQGLVEDLLTLAKADDQGIPLRHQDVDLDDLLIEEVHRIKATTTLHVAGEISAARTVGDPARLRQVVRNLVDNATRHARTSVRLGCHQVAEEVAVVVTVDNDGQVVPPERREMIFDRFTRLQPSRDRDSGGSGLGLAIVRAVVEAHGGTVRATQAPDGWCRFEVRLPATV